MSYAPTGEQIAAVEAFRTGSDLVLQAGAGAGKTSTLRMLAESAPSRRGLYIAYNKAIATDAAGSFPRSVSCSTAHALAYRAIGRNFRERLTGGRMPAYMVAMHLGIYDPIHLGTDVNDLSPKMIARITVDTVSRFCRTADPELARHHVPRVTGYDAPAAYAALQREIHPLAVKVWTDLQQPVGWAPFSHDVYLKMWQLTYPALPADYVLLDEAQDADPVIASIVGNQFGAQRIAVGDGAQAIYEWRGAVDAMSKWPGKRLTLSKSFRFGHAIAGEANRWLEVLDAPLRITGHDPIRSIIGALDTADAILCRTNGGALGEVLECLADGKRVALVGGGQQIKNLAFAAADLKKGKRTDHPELAAFADWEEVHEYVANDSAGSDLAVFVKMIARYGPATIIGAVNKLSDENTAEVVVSTAHRAKGREWNHVKIAGDFQAPKIHEDGSQDYVQPGEARLAYVAGTRARLTLDRGSLSWIDTYRPGLAPVLAAA
jgi:hypothetical protein